MPFSPALWFAASLLWILDAANNVTMEPYRAYVSDRLRPEQHAPGFLTQSAFTGLAQTMAYLAPSALVWLGMSKDTLGANGIPLVVTTAFMVGALLSFTTVYYSIKQVPELPLSDEERAALAAKPRGVGATLAEIVDAIQTMPATMRRLWWMALFQWYGMMCYWIYIVPALARTIFDTSDATSTGFRDAGLLNGQIKATTAGLHHRLASLGIAHDRIEFGTGLARLGHAQDHPARKLQPVADENLLLVQAFKAQIFAQLPRCDRFVKQGNARPAPPL